MTKVDNEQKAREQFASLFNNNQWAIKAASTVAPPQRVRPDGSPARVIKVERRVK